MDHVLRQIFPFLNVMLFGDCDLHLGQKTQDDGSMKLSALTLAAILGLVLGTSPGFSEPIAEDSFESNDVLWTVKLQSLENFDSDVAAEALEVSSDSETSASVQPAWIGDDPGDLGPLWVIQDQNESVLGACWSLYESGEIECVPLYVPPTLSLD